MPVYSHSSLSTYEACPHQYKLHYIDNIKRDEQGIEAFMGSRFHETMEKLYRDLAFKIWTLDELLDYYSMQWDKEYSDNVLIVNKERTADDYRAIGRKCIEGYYKRYYPFDQGRVLGIERQIMIDLDDSGKYKLKGFIDRIVQAADGTYEIHDYKTSGYLPAQKDLDADRQLALYQIGVGSIWNDVRKARLIWHYVVFDKEMVSTRTGEQLAALRKDTVALIEKIESAGSFPYTESSLCKWCAYWDLCPAKKHLHKVAALPVNEYKAEPGVKLVEKYAELDRAKSELQGKIKAIELEQDKIAEAAIEFAEAQGLSVIDGPGARLKVDIKEELKAPTKTEDAKSWDALRGLLIQEGRYEEVSTVNSNMLNYRLRAWPKELLEKVGKYLKRQVSKTVRLVKKQPG